MQHSYRDLRRGITHLDLAIKSEKPFKIDFMDGWTCMAKGYAVHAKMEMSIAVAVAQDNKTLRPASTGPYGIAVCDPLMPPPSVAQTGDYGIAIAARAEGQAMGGVGSLLIFSYGWDEHTTYVTVTVGQDGIEPDTLYTLDSITGKVQKAKP